MQRKVLAMALAGLLLPALALASQPLLVRVDGHVVPMRETVQVTHIRGGTVRVRTWSWRGPDGAATFQVSESRGASAAIPTWALAQMRELQMQMRQVRRIEAALEQPLLTPPVPVLWGGPLTPMPGLAPSLVTGILQPVVAPRAVLPERVIIIGPVTVRAASPPAPARHQGLRT
jgi:hypothetical protein